MDVDVFVDGAYNEARLQLEALLAIYMRAKSFQSYPTSRLVEAHEDEHLEYLFLPHMVAIMEKFSHIVLLDLIEYLNPAGGFVLTPLWDETAKATTKSWDRCRGRWKEWFGVKFGDYEDLLHATSTSWDEDINVLISVRNTIMHGRGFVTRVQRRDQNYVNRLAQLGLAANPADRLLIVDSQMVTYQKWLDAFIFWLGERAKTSAKAESVMTAPALVPAVP
jgi:hypothetical protein